MKRALKVTVGLSGWKPTFSVSPCLLFCSLTFWHRFWVYTVCTHYNLVTIRTAACQRLVDGLRSCDYCSFTGGRPQWARKRNTGLRFTGWWCIVFSFLLWALYDGVTMLQSVCKTCGRRWSTCRTCCGRWYWLEQSTHSSTLPTRGSVLSLFRWRLTTLRRFFCFALCVVIMLPLLRESIRFSWYSWCIQTLVNGKEQLF